MRRVRILLAALCAAATALALTAPAAPASATVPTHGLGAWWQGLPVQVRPLPGDIRLAGAGKAWRVHYLSTSWQERPTVVSGTITLPAGRPPAGGWPVVSAGHGSLGIADNCAPSRTGPTPWERALYEQLLAAGYAVAVTDFEGIGTPGEAPFLEGTSQAYQLADIVRAARWLAPVSRSWAVVGFSQGGHAGLFAGNLAGAYAPGLDHAGTVALAPVNQSQALFSTPGADAPETPANVFLPYFGHGFEITDPDGFVPADLFTAAGLDLIELARTGCLDDVAAAIAGRTNGDLFHDPAAAFALLADLVAVLEVPVAPYPRPVRIAHGTADAAIPWQLTELTAAQLAGAGTDVVFRPVPDVDHLGLPPAAAPQVVDWLDELFTR